MKLSLSQPIVHDGTTYTELEISEPDVGAIEQFQAEQGKERTALLAGATKAAIDAGVPMTALADFLRAAVPPKSTDEDAEDDDVGFTSFVVLMARCANVDPDVIRQMKVTDLKGVKDAITPFLSVLNDDTGDAGAA